jgi:HK97 family phage major capsid protein
MTIVNPREDALRARVAELNAEAEGILSRSDDTLTGDDAERARAIEAELDQLSGQLAEAQKLTAAVNRSLETGRGVISGDGGVAPFNVNTRTTREVWDVDDRPVGRAAPQEWASRAASAIEASPHFGDDAHREAATKLVDKIGAKGLGEQIVLTSHPAYRSGWFKQMSGHQHLMDDQERAVTLEVDEYARAMALTNVTSKLVPAHLDPSVVIANEGSANPFRRIARVEPITTNVWTGVTSEGISGGWTGAEATEVDDDTPTFVNPSVTAYMADAFVPLSFQAYEDWMGGEQEILELFRDYKDRLEEAAFATGDGSAKPTGIVTALVAAGVGRWSVNATNNAYAVTDLFNIKQHLGDRFKPKAQWVMNENYVDRIRQFGDDDVAHAFTVDLTAGGVERLLGKPVNESTTLTGTLSTTTNNHTVYGAFEHYVVADRVGLSVEFVPNLFGNSNRPTMQRGWLAHWRVGGDSILDTGFTLGVNPNTAWT